MAEFIVTSFLAIGCRGSAVLAPAPAATPEDIVALRQIRDALARN